MKITPMNSRVVLGLRTLAAGVESAQLEGAEITGSWKKELRLLVSGGPGKTLVERFLNWSDSPDEILRFTRMYGPLAKATPGEVFRQSLKHWCEHQAFLRREWPGPSLGFKIGLRTGEVLEVTPKELALKVADLERFLEFEIFLHPAARRRICARPDCSTPYFIATHLRQRHCDEKCAEWAQRQYKRDWWAERGDQWRKQRSRRKRKRKKSQLAKKEAI
jgi:hypothetical protein